MNILVKIQNFDNDLHNKLRKQYHVIGQYFELIGKLID